MSANGKGLSSPKGKKFVNIAYCVGAALVIIGALMKIMHWPGWDILLPVGMVAEAILFLLGSFEEPHQEPTHWDWSSVYPDLSVLGASQGPSNKSVKTVESPAVSSSVSINTVTASAPMGVASGISEDDMKKWNESVQKISQTADNISKLSDVGNVSNSYIKKLDAAGNAVDSFAKAQVNSTTLLSSSSESLAENYKLTAKALSEQKDLFSGSADSTKRSFEAVSKNLSSINSVYELQLNLANEGLRANQAQNAAQLSINDQLTLIQKAVMASASSNTKFKDESQKLENNISELNNVYGNMLSSLK